MKRNDYLCRKKRCKDRDQNRTAADTESCCDETPRKLNVISASAAGYPRPVRKSSATISGFQDRRMEKFFGRDAAPREVLFDGLATDRVRF